MKNLKKLLPLSAAAVLVFGCSDDFLDKKPLVDQTADTFFLTGDQAVQATNATYGILRRFDVSVFSYITMTDIVSDDADKGSTPNDAAPLQEIDNFTLDASNGSPSAAWGGYYRGVFRANLSLARIPDVDMDEGLKQRLLAENHFLRAYFYFNLVRWFGDVPLITRQLSPDEYEQARTPTEQVYALIIDDLTFAAANLPEKGAYPAADLGRATRGAANGLLSKVHLTRQQWQLARDRAFDVINSGEYELLPEYDKIFTQEGEHSSESVFEISTVSLGTGGGGSQFNEVQGVRGTPNLGWGFNRPSDNLVAAWPRNDPRRDATIFTIGEALPDGSAIIVGDPGVANQRQNQKAWIARPTSGGNGNGGGNIRVLRYADVLLIAAEATNELGNTEEAIELANRVRTRARGTLPKPFLPELKADSKDEARQVIWLERRLELAMEQQRWFDLVRQGRAAEVMIGVGKTNFKKGKHELFPIPQSEIDLSGAKLMQNPGY